MEVGNVCGLSVPCGPVPELLLRHGLAVMFRVESVQDLLQGLVGLGLGWSRGREGTLKVPKLHLNTEVVSVMVYYFTVGSGLSNNKVTSKPGPAGQPSPEPALC